MKTLLLFDILALTIGNTIGFILGRIFYDEGARWLRRHRHEKLERMVAAELLTRGLNFDSIMLQQLSNDVPPRVTPEVVKRVADRCEQWIRMTTPNPEIPPSE